MALPDWARAYGPPLFAACIRTTPAEFDVTEDLGVEITGDGEHDLLYIRKTGANTEWVARQIASFADVPPKDVGYCGLKDRHAVTRQWFSVPRWNKPKWRQAVIDGVEVIDVKRHARKLHRGTHKANSFRIVLRGELGGPGNRAALQARLQQLEMGGAPNYFGRQRFGRNGSNLTLANRWSSGGRMPRHKRGLAISTARSYLFNEILSQRVADNTWNTIQSGDIANLDGTRSVFTVDVVDDDIETRCRKLDLHPTALLCGDGVLEPNANNGRVPAGYENWLAALSKSRVKPQQRSLRLVVRDLAWEIGSDALTLTFRLNKGAYATSVLREIADVVDAGRDSPLAGP